jgi:hypothetical protein
VIGASHPFRVGPSTLSMSLMVRTLAKNALSADSTRGELGTREEFPT